MKDTGTGYWPSPNIGATNETGFTALPRGIYQGGGQALSGQSGFWWISTSAGSGSLWRRTINDNKKGIDLYSDDHSLEFSVRLIKDQ